jgi:YHS domain-containing protein
MKAGESLIRRSLSAAGLVLISALVACSSSVNPINVTSEGVAIKGYDPVAYFTEGRPVKGKEEFQYEWKGAKWRFASEEHRALFKSSPDKYAPRYGGYCAYAVSQGKTADIDPDAWNIVNGKLYLNLNKDVQRIWNRDIPGYIMKADHNWPHILDRK